MVMSKDSVSKGTVLFVAMVGSFVTPFMGSSVNIALPAIQKELAMDAVLLSWVQTAFLLAAAVFMVPVGRLSDIYGRKKTFLWGMVCFTAATMVCGLCSSAAGLIAARVGQGVGSAMIFASGLAIITSVFPLGERGRAIGFTVAAVYVGLSLGPVLGGLLTQNWGWRSIFWVNVPLGLTTIFLVLWKLTGEWAEARGERFDLAGSLIYGFVLAAVMFGLSLLPDLKGLGLIALGLAGLAVFIKWELATAAPVFQIELFRTNVTFAFSNLAALIHYSATFGLIFLMSLFLQYIKGLPPQKAGFILVTQPLVMAVFSPLAGRLSDRIEPRLVASTGMALTGLGLLFFTFLDPASALGLIIGNLALIGLGFALFSSPNTNAIMSSVSRKFLGQASGAVSTMRLIGQMVSMGLAALVFALVIGRVRITPEYYPAFLRSIRIAFMIFTGLCVLGVIASLQRGRVLTGPDRSGG